MAGSDCMCEAGAGGGKGGSLGGKERGPRWKGGRWHGSPEREGQGTSVGSRILHLVTFHL